MVNKEVATSNLDLISMTRKVLISFVMIVLVLAVPSLIMVTCPTCNGAGHVSTISGAENLRVLSIKSKVIYSAKAPCVSGGAIRSAFDVTLANVGSKPVHGLMEIIAINPETGLTLTKRLMYVEMPANKTGYTYSGTITYVGSTEVTDLKVSVHIPLGEEVPCPSCGGRGQVSTLRWPIVYLFGGLKPVGPPEVPPEIPLRPPP